MKILRFFLVLLLINLIESFKIDCTYEYAGYAVMGHIYQCQVKTTFIINSRETATIDSVTENHDLWNNNNNVNGFVADHKNLKYFPRGLEKIFINLQLFRIRFTTIEEITQSELKPFPLLKELDLHENKITIIEDGLFDFNPNLKFVSFSNNKIYRIGSKVFDSLNNLKWLYLSANDCIDSHANDNRQRVEIVIKEAKEKCIRMESFPEVSSIKPVYQIFDDYYDEDPVFIEHFPSTVKGISEKEIIEIVNKEVKKQMMEFSSQVNSMKPDNQTLRENNSSAVNRNSESGSSLQITIIYIIIFLLVIVVVGGIFYYFLPSRYGSRRNFFNKKNSEGFVNFQE